MASVSIFNKQQILLKSIDQYNFSQVSINEKDNKNITINELLPFRVRITDIDIIGFGPNNVPPIPLQIIGISNYIL
jgi:hypothetical protein